MGGEWKTEPLERLVDPTRGISYGIVQPGTQIAEGVPIVRVRDIRDGRIATENPLRVSREIERRHSRTRLNGGELLMTLVGTVGEAAVVPKSLAGWNTARAVAVIPVRENVGSYWVKLALQSPEVRQIIDSRLNTTVQATLNLRDVAKLPILLPPEAERRAIAHIIGALDDKIDLNRRMSETLESIARALFKSWFVDFDPVRAKAEGRAHSLPDRVADLFPDRLVESELSEIPNGWEVSTLASLIELQRGFDLPTDKRSAGQYPVMSAGGHHGTHNEFRVRGPGVTTGRSGVIGNVYYVHDDFWPLNTSLWVKSFRHSKPAHAYHLLRGIDFDSFSAGSAVPTLNRNHVHSLLVVCPPMKVIDVFEDVAASILKRQRECDQESKTLSNLLHTLLPKLISGEVRIKDAERFLERAGV